MKEISTIGIDIAKNNFRLVGMTKAGKVVLRKWVCREELLAYMSNFKPCLVGMEACASANYWAREFKKQGHEVKLMPPQYVKPYVKTNKNDTNDAEACAEAVRRPTMRFSSIRSENQQVLGQLHRVRDRLVRVRTALGNEIRGFLGEFGIFIPRGIEQLRLRVAEAVLRHKEQLSEVTTEMISRMDAELRRVEEELGYYNKKIHEVHQALPESQRLDTIPGVGEITATALVAIFPGAGHFKNGRQFAAYLGLVPRQYSTGGKSRLGRISKRGDPYIRKLLVQGSQSVLKSAKGKKDRYHRWAAGLCERRGWCRAAVAIANKNARICWKVLAEGKKFEADHEPQWQAA